MFYLIILEFQKELTKLSKDNKKMLKKMKLDLTKKANNENKERVNTEKLSEKELEYLKLTVEKLEVKQLAES